MKIVIVKWIDTATTFGWRDKHNDCLPQPCESIGYLIHQDRLMVKIAQSITEDGDYGVVTTIPCGVIEDVITVGNDGKSLDRKKKAKRGK